MENNINYKELTRNTLSNGGFLMVNKKIARFTSIEAATLLAALISYEKYFEERKELTNGFFYNTQDKIQHDTTLSPYKQRNSYRLLVEKDLIKVWRHGIPAKNYYKINHQKIFDILSQEEDVVNPYKKNINNLEDVDNCPSVENKKLKNFTARSERLSQQAVEKFDINNRLKQKTINNSSRRPTTNSKDKNIILEFKGSKAVFLDRFVDSYSLYRNVNYRTIGPDLNSLKSCPEKDIKYFLDIDNYYIANGRPGLFQRWLDPDTLGYRDEWANENTDLGIAILLKPDIFRRYIDQFKGISMKIKHS